MFHYCFLALNLRSVNGAKIPEPRRKRKEKGKGAERPMFGVILRLFLCLRPGQVVFSGEFSGLEAFSAPSEPFRVRSLATEEACGPWDYSHICINTAIDLVFLGDCIH